MNDIAETVIIAQVFGNVIKEYGPYALIELVNRYLISKYDNPAFLTWKWAPTAVSVLEKVDLIYQEVVSILRGNFILTPFEFVDPSQRSFHVGHNWKVFMLQIHGNFINSNVQLVPNTLESIALARSWNAFISVYEPGCVVPIHVGPSKGLLTYHLAIEVPQDKENCYMIINQEKSYKYKWEERQGVLYDDSYPNTIVNNTKQRLVVLYINFKRHFEGIDGIINDTTLRLVSKNRLVLEACQRAVIKRN